MNAIEEAQIRVARAQEERDRLHDRVQGEYGSIDTMSMYARSGNARAADLRRAYNRAAKELRLAKQDLELMRARDMVLEAECKDHGRERELRDGLMYCCRCGGCLGPEELPTEDEPGESRNVTEEDCKGCMFEHSEDAHECCGCEVDGDEAGNPTHYEPASESPWWRGGPLDTVNGMPWHVAVAECPWGDHVILQPGRYTDDSEDDGRICVDLTEPHEVYGPTTPSGALLNISSRQQEPASGFMQHIAAKIKEGEAANAARKKSMSVVFSEEGVSIDGRAPLHPAVVSAAIDAVKARKGKQVDLEGNPVKLPDGIKEEKNVRRSRVYEHDKFVLRISEDDLAEMWSMDPIDARTLVAKKLRLAPKEQLFEGEWDKEVQYLTDELTKISRQVSRELAAAMRGEA